MFLRTSVRTIEAQDESQSQEEAETPNDLDGRRGEPRLAPKGNGIFQPLIFSCDLLDSGRVALEMFVLVIC